MAGKVPGIDMQSRRVLRAVLRQPRADIPAMAAELEMSEEVVVARMKALEKAGILTGFGPRINAALLGFPHEVLVQGAPSATTSRGALETLCRQPGVTRVFTLAARNSVAFTVRGDDVERIESQAQQIANAAGLVDIQTTLIVDTLHDDIGQGVGAALAESPQERLLSR